MVELTSDVLDGTDCDDADNTVLRQFVTNNR